jgi:hypothetical protein
MPWSSLTLLRQSQVDVVLRFPSQYLISEAFDVPVTLLRVVDLLFRVKSSTDAFFEDLEKILFLRCPTAPRDSDLRSGISDPVNTRLLLLELYPFVDEDLEKLALWLEGEGALEEFRAMISISFGD